MFLGQIETDKNKAHQDRELGFTSINLSNVGKNWNAISEIFRVDITVCTDIHIIHTFY